MKRFTTEHVRAIERKLQQLPPFVPDGHSKQEAIVMLAGTIAGLEERGYSRGQIADLLQAEGLGLTASTLSSYLPKGNRKGKAARARRRNPDSGKPSVSPHKARAARREVLYRFLITRLADEPGQTIQSLAAEYGLSDSSLRKAVQRINPDLHSARTRQGRAARPDAHAAPRRLQGSGDSPAHRA